MWLTLYLFSSHARHMIRAFTLSLAQIFDRSVISVLLRVLALTLTLFLVLGFALWWGADLLAERYGWGETGDMAAAIGALFVGILSAWLLFRVVAIAIMGIYADAIVEAVERRHYPGALHKARPIDWRTSLRMGLASAGRAIAFNLAALPLYLLLLVTGVGSAIVFFIVNALLLGRDLGEMVAIRHMPREAIRDWLATTRVERFLLGLVATGLFVVPVANLAAPILGAAMATHLFHGRKT